MEGKRFRGIDWCLLILALVNVVSCVGGAWGLAASGPEFFGDDILGGTLFADKYGLAALALGVVGVVQLAAVVVHLRRNPWTGVAHAFAGMTMMVFLFVEVLIVDEYFFLQPLFFAIGAIQLSLSPLMRSLVPTPNHDVRSQW